MPFFVIRAVNGRPWHEIDWRDPGARRPSERLGREVFRVEISEALAYAGIDKVLEVARHGS